MDDPDWEQRFGDVGLGLEGPSSMAKVVLGLLNTVWVQQYIPTCWKTASLVSIFKKGDPLDMDNYRGISLMPVILKILTIK